MEKSFQDTWTGPPAISLRDWLAGMALGGLLANGHFLHEFFIEAGAANYGIAQCDIVKVAYEYADKMLAERKRREERGR